MLYTHSLSQTLRFTIACASAVSVMMLCPKTGALVHSVMKTVTRLSPLTASFFLIRCTPLRSRRFYVKRLDGTTKKNAFILDSLIYIVDHYQEKKSAKMSPK